MIDLAIVVIDIAGIVVAFVIIHIVVVAMTAVVIRLQSWLWKPLAVSMVIHGDVNTHYIDSLFVRLAATDDVGLGAVVVAVPIVVAHLVRAVSVVFEHSALVLVLVGGAP